MAITPTGPPALVDITSLPLATAVIDATDRLVAVNAAMAALVGSNHTQQVISDLHHIELWAAFAELLKTPSVSSSSSAVSLPHPVRHSTSGVLHQIWVSAPDESSARVVMASPVLAATDTVEELDAPDEAMSVIVDAAARAHELMGHGVVVGDGRRLLHVSDGAARLFGRSSQELVEIGSLLGLLQPGEHQRIGQLVEDRRTLGLEPLEHFETTLVRPDGSLLPVELWVKAKVEGAQVRTYTLIADARERRAQHDQLARRALHDQLTGLPNRFLLMDRLETVIARLARQGGSAMLAFIDLDGFKEVNDHHGHLAGDVVLRTTAERISSGIRSCDTVARIGGDEFVVLCSDTVDHQAIEVLTERLSALVSHSVEGDGWSVDVQASVGAVAFADGELDADTLLAHADLAMYAAKSGQVARSTL